MNGFPVRLLATLRCKKDDGVLSVESSAKTQVIQDGEVYCTSCNTRYPINTGILDLLDNDMPEHQESQLELQVRDKTTSLSRAGDPNWTPTWYDIIESRAMLRQMGDPTNKLILEFGCGPGFYTHQLAGTCHGLLAVDFSREQLVHNSKNNPYPEKVGYVRADVSQIRLSPNTFDLAFNTLYSNLPTYQIRLACNHAAFQGLKPGKKYIVCAQHQSLRRILKRLPASGRYPDIHTFYENFDIATLRNELVDFNVSTISPIIIELPLLTRIKRTSVQIIISNLFAKIPGLNLYGALLLATAIKPD